MKKFEDYKNANYGKKIVTWYNNTLGVSKEYLTWFISCVVCHKMPLYIALNAYKDWKQYVIPYYKENNMPIPKIDNQQYEQVINIINQCKRSWAKPNPIYDKDGVYVGEFKSFRDANMLPINTNWCITKTHKQYNEFNNANSKCLYVINNNNQDPYKRVIAVVYTDRIEYWDSANQRIENNANYENTLPTEVVNIIYNTSISNDNKNDVNPSIIWVQIYDLLNLFSKKMKAEYTKRMRANNPITSDELDTINKEIHDKLDYLMTWQDESSASVK